MTDFQQFFYYVGLFSTGWVIGRIIREAFNLMKYDYKDGDRD